MRYKRVVEGIFVRRLNRFVALVTVEGVEQTVHVRNTGRCTELLHTGTRVVLEVATGGGPARKTDYSLIAVYKDDRLINIDSLAPNRVVQEALEQGLIPELGKPEGLRSEVTYSSSRFDFHWPTGMVPGGAAYLEVKGVTLEEGNVVRFPDAPTARGAKHVRELIDAAAAGMEAHVFFLIQMEGVAYFEPNVEMDPRLANALRDAAAGGVRIWAYDCRVTPDELLLGRPVEVRI